MAFKGWTGLLQLKMGVFKIALWSANLGIERDQMNVHLGTVRILKS